MSIERIENMKSSLMSCVESQISDLKNVDTHELGEAIDMIKDLSEAAYYCTITEAMKSSKEETSPEVRNNYYTEKYIPMGTRYYGGDWNDRDPIMYMGPDTHGNIGGNRYYDDGMNIRYYEDNNPKMSDMSSRSRKMYMEAKHMHKGTAAQMKELENYLQDLSKDIYDMIEDASSEERLLLQQKLVTLANKVKPNVVAQN